MKQITIILALGLAAFGAAAQNTLRLTPGNPGMAPAAVTFTPGLEPDFTPGTVLVKQNDNDTYIRSTDVILKHSEADRLGQQHFRYQQKINNIPVEGATYVLHVANGKVKSQNGQWVATLPADIATTPAISQSDALDLAMKAFGATSYKWQLPDEEQFIKKESADPNATFLPKAELVYYSGEEEVAAGNMRLAYKLDLYAHQPIGRRIYFVDAQTGTILGKREIMHTINATGSAVTAYSGTQSIITDAYNGSYRLRETGRGNGIQTFNLAKGTNYSAATDFTDADNSWNNVNAASDQYATDAHWGAEKTYDYYYSTFGRNSINDAGFAIKSYVHYSNNYFNAFWDGSRMTYGDGDSYDSYKPLTAIDVCGHEITHGLTSYTANLNYSGESGALNEGFSDIFGTTIEFYANPATANWLIGEAFYTIRSMSNPNAYGQPDTYQGTSWAGGTADNGGVHTNSGVLNYWYYLLAQGGSGTNDKSTAYAVSGIGLSKAAAIAYRTLTVYLTSTSKYIDARTYSIQAAKDLYGDSTNEVTQVTNAWNAVGVGAAATPPASSCTDNYESNESGATAKTIGVNTDITAKIGSTTDKDYFVFTTTGAAPKVKVTLSNLPYDYDMRLYNSAGYQIGISQNTGTATESITYNGSSAGSTYYVYVYGYNYAYSATSCYTLRASTSNVNQLTDAAANTLNAGIAKPGVGAALSGEEEEDVVSVYPNPAKDQLTLRFSAVEAGRQSMSVTDLMGRVIMIQAVDVQQGVNEVRVPVNNYASGMYFLKLEGRQPVRFQVTQ